ncbi:MAG: hypothetical protein HEQ23_09480 [Tepidisphaera sp.]
MVVWPYWSKRNHIEVTGVVVGHEIKEGRAPRSNAPRYGPLLKIRYQSSVGEVVTNLDPEIHLEWFRSKAEARQAGIDDFPLDSSITFHIDPGTGIASAASGVTERMKLLVVLTLGAAALFAVLALRSE